MLKKTLFAGATALAVAASAAAHDPHYTGLRHAHDLPDALRAAQAEARHVLLHLESEPGTGLRAFRWPDPGAGAALDTVVLETVVCELEGAAAARAADRFDAEVGALLLLSPEGDRLAVLDPADDARSLVARIAPTVRGADARVRVEEYAFGRGHADPLSGARLAGFLAAAGELDDAAEILAERVERSLAPRPEERILAARRGLELGALSRAAQRSDRARAAFERARRAIEAALLVTERADVRLASDYGSIARARGELRRATDLFERMHRTNRARSGLLDAVFPLLVERGRYTAIAELTDPERAFEGELAVHRRARLVRPTVAETGEGRGSRAFTVARGRGYAEVLVALGDTEAAARVAQRALALDASPAVRAGLIDALRRGGAESPEALVAPTKSTAAPKEVR